MAALIRAGYHVSIPFHDNLAYDFVITKDDKKFERVQVKRGIIYDGTSSIKVRLSRSRYQRGGKKGVVKYKPDEFDYVAVYCEDLDKSYLVPVKDELGKKFAVYLTIGGDIKRKTQIPAEDYEI